MSILERARQRQQPKLVPVEDGLAQAAYQESMRPRYVGTPVQSRVPNRVLTPEQARALEMEEARKAQQARDLLMQQEMMDYQESMRPVGVR